MMLSKKQDIALALIFCFGILVFLFAMTIPSFFKWAFERHHNQWSWYIRPLFLIPFCYFAYIRSWAGVSFSLLAMLTSMFWFPAPQVAQPQVEAFLNYEKSYLTEGWTWSKALFALLVPFTLFLLALAFWKRNIYLGLGVMALIAFGKVLWSITSAGEAGKSIIAPAVFGLLICVGIVYSLLKKRNRKS